MPVPLYIVDAFAAQAFRGNPAAVCLLESAAEAGWMQKVAAEMNLSETAFVVPQGDGYHLRWFTPKVEVDLCGHATLASAFVLWSQEKVPSSQPIKFHSKSGLLTCTRQGEWIEMDFPAEPVADASIPPALAEGLGTSIKYVGLNRHDYLVEVANEATLRALKPDLGMLAILPVRGIILTCVSQKPEYDFFCRFFAPLAGVAEDPVTGSAHCALGPYWAKRLNKQDLTSFQASTRGGVVKVKAAGNRVVLSGQSVLMLRGELLHTK